MDHSLKQLVDLASGLLKSADVGREYTMDYVASRLESAMDEYPNDSVIRSVAAVIEKQAKNGKLITSQKEIYDVYNHFAGQNANSMIKEAIGDILYPAHKATEAKISNETAYTYRPTTPEISFHIEHNPLETLFDKNTNVTSYYDPTLAKLAKHAIAEELNNIGVVPSDIKVFAGNDQGIVYDVVFKNKLGIAHVAIPVDVSNQKVSAPDVFFSNSQLIELTAENLNKHIVDVSNVEEAVEIGSLGGINTSASVISSSFAFEEDAPEAIKIDRVAMPEALRDIMSYEDAAMESSTGFSIELVRTAKALCTRELNNMGFRTQVALAEATDNCIICSAELNSSVGKIEIKLPVEIVNDRLQIPALFYNEASKDKMYDFTKAELSSYLTAAKIEDGQILRYSNDFFNMNYGQLKGEILQAVAKKDYARAEQALSRIEDKFGSEQHKSALTDYSKYLAYSSADHEAPEHKCRLLITKGSVEPRCGHYNVPLHRVATDIKGNCELLDRKAKYDNLAESTGVLIQSNKITLT
jgi:hypothetical protein